MKEKQNLFKGKIIFMQKSLVSALLFAISDLTRAKSLAISGLTRAKPLCFLRLGLTESLMKIIIEAL